MSIKTMARKMMTDYKNKSVQKNARRIFEKVERAFASCETEWFIDFGTLLGVVRNQRILGWDGDIDVGIIYRQDKMPDMEMIKKAFYNEGFTLRGINYYNDSETLVKFLYRRAPVDIHLYFEEEGGLACYLHQTKGKIEVDKTTTKKKVTKLTCADITDTVKKPVYGIEVPVPANYEQILVDKYGTTWHIEDKNWKSSQTPEIVFMDDYGIAMTRPKSKLLLGMVREHMK